MHFDRVRAACDGAVDDEVGEVVELVDLRTLSEVLDVLDGQLVKVEGVGEQALGFVVHAVEIEPERSSGRDEVGDSVSRRRCPCSVYYEGALHETILLRYDLAAGDAYAPRPAGAGPEGVQCRERSGQLADVEPSQQRLAERVVTGR